MSLHRVVVASTRDPRSAVGLMDALSKDGGCLVEVGQREWLVLARCDEATEHEELLRQVASWASDHPASELEILGPEEPGWSVQ